MHGNLAANGVQSFLVAGRLQRDENAELAETVSGSVVDVGRDDAVFDRQGNRAAQVHVFADGGDGVLDRVGNGLAGRRVDGSTYGVNGAVGGECYVGNATNHRLEGVVTGNEVGFRVDFDDDGLGAGAGDADEAFGSRAA